MYHVLTKTLMELDTREHFLMYNIRIGTPLYINFAIIRMKKKSNKISQDMGIKPFFIKSITEKNTYCFHLNFVCTAIC